MSSVIFELKNVMYSYKVKTGANVNVIRNATCTFESGKIYAIQSIKESGKSTLLKIMAGLDRPDSGEILYNGENIAEWDSYVYRKTMTALALSGMDLIERYTVMDHILAQLDVSCPEKTDKHEQMAKEILSDTGIDKSLYNKKANRLDGYNRQVLRLARALATFGNVILFDDVDLELSKEETGKFLELIRRIAREKEKCIIFTTESPLTAMEADEIYTVNRGTVIKIKKVG
jgi:putative ABC transport system ATP-binding protein